MSAASMRVATLHGAGDLRIESQPVPSPGRGELLLEVEAALLGGTARKVFRRGYHARMGTPPLHLGHEGVGRILAIGEGVTRWNVGQRVLPANSAPCSSCPSCSRGLTAQCQDMVWLNGFFATHVIVPDRIAQVNTYALPDTLDSRVAGLTENLACVLKGMDQTPVRPGMSAVVIGAGPIGCLWAWALARAGAQVIVLARSEASQARAGTLDGVTVQHADEAPACDWVDLVVEAAGTGEAWHRALEVASPGARIQLFGGPPKGTELLIDAQDLHYDELTITASFHHTPYHFAEALRVMASDGAALASLVEADIALDDVPDWMTAEHAIAKARVLP